MDYKDLVTESSTPVKLSDGRTVPSIDLDNASTKPIFHSVLKTVNEYAPMYTTVNGGHSQKSLYSKHQFEQTREDVLNFLKADKKTNVTLKR